MQTDLPTHTSPVGPLGVRKNLPLDQRSCALIARLQQRFEEILKKPVGEACVIRVAVDALDREMSRWPTLEQVDRMFWREQATAAKKARPSPHALRG